jgi:hypothetical protein
MINKKIRLEKVQKRRDDFYQMTIPVLEPTEKQLPRYEKENTNPISIMNAHRIRKQGSYLGQAIVKTQPKSGWDTYW